MSFNFLIDDEWQNNNFELVSDLTEHTRIAKISIGEDGVQRFYQRKPTPIYDVWQESSIKQVSICFDYKSLYQTTAAAIGVLSFVAFSYGLYLLYPKLMELIDLTTNLDSNRNKLNHLTNQYESLKKINIPKKVNQKFINKYFKSSDIIDSLEISFDKKGYLTKGIRNDFNIAHKEVLGKVAGLLLEGSEKIHMVEEKAIKIFEDIIFSPFTGLIPVSTLGMLGAIYVYEAFEEIDYS